MRGKKSTQQWQGEPSTKGHHTRGSERLDKMLFHRIAGGGTARGNLDFAIDRSQVVVNGSWADDQLLGDLCICLSLCQESFG
jgi:hypothetical protein